MKQLCKFLLIPIILARCQTATIDDVLEDAQPSLVFLQHEIVVGNDSDDIASIDTYIQALSVIKNEYDSNGTVQGEKVNLPTSKKLRFVVNYRISNDWKEVFPCGDDLICIVGILGVPFQKFTSTADVEIDVETMNGAFVKKYIGYAQDTEYEALYYGYKEEDAKTLAMNKAFHKAFNDVLKQIDSDAGLKDLATASEKALNASIKQEQQAAEQRRIEKERKAEERKKRLIATYGEKYATLVLQGKIALGMSEQALIESWGKPDDINESVGSWGVHKQYVYGSAYVHVENGTITSYSK